MAEVLDKFLVRATNVIILTYNMTVDFSIQFTGNKHKIESEYLIV